VTVDRHDHLKLLTGIHFRCLVLVVGLVVLYFAGNLAFRHIVVVESQWSTIRSMNQTAG
jgi:hypothetical protein